MNTGIIEKAKQKFKFSVIMPIYNVENYLDECVQSLLDQSIGFKDNIQLIFINDGSPDNSEEICLKYKAMYPDNIIYVKQENSGVSIARNNGKKYALGKYINFLDSDDKWSLDTFEKVWEFFEEHYKETDLATTAIKRFEASDIMHVGNYRLKYGTRVADLTTPREYNSVVVQVSSVFFKASAIENISFIENMKNGEDCVFVNTVISDRMTVGFVDGPMYYYRLRADKSSAVQEVKVSSYYFLDNLIDQHMRIIELSKQKFNCVLPYFQNVVYYDFAWRLSLPVYHILNKEEMQRFEELSAQLLSEIDDNIILYNVVHLPLIKKIAAFDLKYGKDYFLKNSYVVKRKDGLYFKRYKVFEFSRNKFICYLNSMDIDKKYIRIDGFVSAWLFDATNENVRMKFQVGNKTVNVKLRPYKHKIWKYYKGERELYLRFTCKIPLDKYIKDNPHVRIRPLILFGKNKVRVGMNYNKFVSNTNSFATSYKIYNNYYVKACRTVIHVEQFRGKDDKYKRILSSELKCLKYLRSIGENDIARLRLRYCMYKLSHKENERIWLISDRVENAGDNGEVFFKYVCANKPKNVRPIFVISKNAACVDRLKSEGEVIFFEDRDYPLYFLLAEKIISSGASDFTMNPFGENRKYVVDLFKFKYYYLQHGVACADLSGWLNRSSKNLFRIFTSSEKERQGFLNDAYYYTKRQIVTTGQARFDDLYDKREKLILILPTWRKSIKESYDSNTTSVYFDGFKKTAYFKYYNRLINDERLLAVMRKHGYKGLFCMHPIHMKQTVDYQSNDVFSVNEGYVDYNDVFARASLMVTDYSSVLFDFAYLRKSVIYTQFDKKEFFAGQIYDEGYFSYENDGFGPVCYDYESTVNALIEAVERDCVNSEKYLERVNSFFEYSDKENCKRILAEIIK